LGGDQLEERHRTIKQYPRTNTSPPSRKLTLLPDLPSVKPSAIALGTVFNHAAELAVLTPLFGQTYQRAKAANTKEEFLRSREATGAAIAWGTAFVGSGLQAYGVGALINATGTLSYKGAAYLGGLIFAATSAPSVSRYTRSETGSGYENGVTALLTSATVHQPAIR
jgi:hypothetical protein